MTITRVLVRRAVLIWLLLRFMVLAISVAERAGMSRATMPPFRDSPFFSFAAVPFMLVCASVLSEVDVARRHERVLLGNLGISPSARVSLALGVAVLGEIVFGIASAMLLP